MKNALIIFGSTTGNTENVADKIGKILSNAGFEVSIKDVAKASIGDLNGGHTAILLGASTWGDDDIEFQEDFAPFYEAMDKAELKGKKLALFGCGDSSYTHFCGAVTLLERKVEELGGILLNEPLRIDGDPDSVLSEIEEWAGEVAAKA